MRYHSYYTLVLIGIFSMDLHARELRTPLDALSAPFHSNYQDTDENCKGYRIGAVGYHRSADRAFTNKLGTETTNHASLYFGTEDFLAEEAFSSRTVLVPTNPWLNLVTMTPRVTYQEHGVVWNFEYAYRADSCSPIYGIRARLPFRTISINRFKHCDQQGSELGTGNFDTLVRYKLEEFADVGGTLRTIVTFAYRLDLLSNLIYNGITPGSTVPLVKYQAPITMAGSATGRQGAGNAVNPFRYPLSIIKRSDSSAPIGSFGQFENDNYIPIDMRPTELNAAGTNLQSNSRGFFLGTTDYSPLGANASTQSMLWVVPGIERQASSINLSPEADVLRSTVNDLLQSFNTSAEDFFIEQGLCFADYQRTGLGDLDVEYYYGDQLLPAIWSELLIGLRFPTAKKLTTPQELFAQPCGNNGHFEIRLGGTVWYNLYKCLQLKGHADYNIVCSRTETINAPFKGAAIKNIGPTIDATISWNYFSGYLNAIIMHPSSPSCGFSLGYELYKKCKDKIELTQRELKDLLGTTRELDATIAEQHTSAATHKIVTEFFWQHTIFDFCAGWTHACAGKNAPKESDLYVRMALSF